MLDECAKDGFEIASSAASLQALPLQPLARSEVLFITEKNLEEGRVR